MNPFSLEQKWILVTGVTGGIGQSIVSQITELGGSVIGVGRSVEKLAEMTESYPASIFHLCDLTRQDDLISLMPSIGSLNGVVHAAGVVHPLPIKFLSRERLDQILNLNLHAPVELSRLLLKEKKLVKGCSHVFISSISGEHPHKGGGAYAISKAGLQAFSKTLALETAHIDMRSNCISPAMIATPMYDVAKEKMSSKKMEEHMEGYPLGVGYPKDVAHAVCFLLSAASRWITGINLTLDGGFLLSK